MRLNPHIKKMQQKYLFSLIESKERKMRAKNPHALIANLGIGDVILPLAPTIARSIQNAIQEMTIAGQMKGYGPSEGYLFLREAIAQQSYKGLSIASDEIFISEGANCDMTSLPELFSNRCKIGIIDPTYPAYLSSITLSGKKSKVTLIPCLEENHFVPFPPKEHLDIVYLCSPNNPTGIAMSRENLRKWVEYAHREKAILLLDNAYEAFITSPDVPRSIYEIDGAKEVAIESRSFSKSAGFTGLRCAYLVIPRAILKNKLRDMWEKRQSIKSNGVSYPIQRGAEAALSAEGIFETQQQIVYYLHQAKLLRQELLKLGFSCFGGQDSPYIWWKTPKGEGSWEFFQKILEKNHLISTPGSGFGIYGEGYVRLSAFTTQDQTELALAQIKSISK